jgi:hypothetical protein
MQLAARSYVMAAAALAATGGLVGVTPMPPRQPAIRIASPAVRLVDSDSILNIPFNLFQDIVNIPYNEVEAFNDLGDGQLFAGTWLTSSATNLWGEDPGDPTRFQSLVEMAIPFSQISGLGTPEVGAPGWDQADVNEAANGTLPLAQQITLLLDAEIPVSPSSDADWSAPLIPVSTITGDTGIDRAIWTAAIFTDQTQFPLTDNWFQTPLSDLTSGGYNFGDVVDPSQGVGPGGSVPSDFGYAGTIPGPDGENLMPWSNLTFEFNPVSPFENFFTSLEAPVDPSTYASGFEIPTFTEISQAFETNLAGLVVAFDPFVPGSFLCSDACDVPSYLTPEGILAEINTAMPGDPSVQEWLNLFNTPSTDEFGQANPFGMANGPTTEQIDAISWLESGDQQQYDFGNPSPSDPPSNINDPISFGESQEIQNLIALAQQNIIPGYDFPGTTGSSIQDFYQWQADSSGYTPIDYGSDTWLTTLPPESVELGSFGTLLSDLGLGSLASLF